VRAVVLTESGLGFEEFPDPKAGRGEVVIELHAAAVNRRDLLVCNPPSPAYRFPHPLIPGSDGAGIRQDTGEEVVINPGLFWGSDPRAAGSDWQILGGPSNGTYAELVKVPVENVFPKPLWLSWREAAALPLAAVTAFRALFTIGGLTPGETVVILGASGGVATTAISLASHVGANVLVTTSNEKKLSRAVARGANGGVLYTNPEWVNEIRELNGGEGVDLVFDSIGSTWDASLGCLRRGGRVVAFGGTGGARVDVDVRLLYLNWLSIRGTTMGSPQDFADLMSLIDVARIRPEIDAVLPLQQAAAAHERMRAGEHFGKLVLDIRG